MTNVPLRIGRYEVLRHLGAGGMGVIYLARDPMLHRTVAIKVLSTQSPQLRLRFAREARSAAALNHEGIVTVYDVGEDAGQPFIAMEYVEGETLADLIKRRPPLSIAQKLRFVLDLCSALAYAHRLGVIHRDVKPANVMITPDGVLKVLDFGLARVAADALSAGLTDVGTLLGTPHYMAPEIVQGEPADHRSDIFAVGLVLYELLAYRRAYAGNTPAEVLYNIVQCAPPPLRDVCDGVPPGLEQIVARAISKSRDQRYQSLAGLADALVSILGSLGEQDATTLTYQGPVAPNAGPLRPASTAGSTPRPVPSPDALSLRRSAMIDQHVVAAQRNLDEGQLDVAIEHCEQVLVLRPDEPRALELLQEAHARSEYQRLQALVAEVEGYIQQGALTAAEQLVERAGGAGAESPDVIRVRRAIREQRAAQERERDRRRELRALLDSAARELATSRFDAALRLARQALHNEPRNAEALRLEQLALGGQAEQSRRLAREQEDQRLLANVRTLIEEGNCEDALDALEAIDGREAEVESLRQAIRARLVTQHVHIRDFAPVGQTGSDEMEAPERGGAAEPPAIGRLADMKIAAEAPASTRERRRPFRWVVVSAGAAAILMPIAWVGLSQHPVPPQITAVAESVPASALTGAAAPTKEEAAASSDTTATATGVPTGSTVGGSRRASEGSTRGGVAPLAPDTAVPSPTATAPPTQVEAVGTPDLPGLIVPFSPETLVTVLAARAELPSAPAPAPPASNDPAPADNVLRDVLERFRVAYQGGDIPAMLGLYPGMSRDQQDAYAKYRRDCRTIGLTFAGLVIRSKDSKLALIETQSEYACTPATRQRNVLSEAADDMFSLARGPDGRWTIERMWR